MKRDYYTYTTRRGTRDFNTYENKLEKLKKLSDSVLRKIGSHQMICDSEKRTFASYISMMERRVPRRREKTKNLWPEVLESIKSWSKIIRWLDSEEAETSPDDVETLSRLSMIRDKVNMLIEDYRKKIPEDLFLGTMVMESWLIPIIYSMNWQFLVARDGMEFVTSDKPVFFEEFGLNKPYSEITFPISTDIALAASWHTELGEGFFPATDAAVEEINWRTASAATCHVFASCKAKWILEVFNKNRHHVLKEISSIKRRRAQ
jgi:uncharacterized protein DUF4238